MSLSLFLSQNNIKQTKYTVVGIFMTFLGKMKSVMHDGPLFDIVKLN